MYISTSDVQMHANYHRKDSAIIQEGFQRFRATENCNSSTCVFADQKTTHFHCRRSGCSYTFKNKSDMGMCTCFAHIAYTGRILAPRRLEQSAARRHHISNADCFSEPSQNLSLFPDHFLPNCFRFSSAHRGLAVLYLSHSK